MARRRATWIVLVCTVFAAACGSSSGDDEGAADDSAGDDSGSGGGGGGGGGGGDGGGSGGGGGGDGGGGGGGGVVCSGTVTGGLQGALSGCGDSWVWRYADGRVYTGITVTLLDGVQLDTGPCSFSYHLPGDPTVGTTYGFGNVVRGVSNLYEVHPMGPMTIWACGTDGTVTYGSDLALVFTEVIDRGEVSGVHEWQVHGHVGCRYVSSDGSPEVVLALTF